MDQRVQFIDCIPRLRRYARALVSDRAAADDLTQETLERAWTKLAQFRQGSDLRAWIFSIMHNLHASEHRRHREADTGDRGEPEIGVRATQGDGLEVRDLDRALNALPVDSREILLLITLEELSYVEAAAVLGIPVGTVMSRLSRAREKLRQLLDSPAAAQKLTVVK